MLGPLPLLYRCLVFVAALVICMGVGAWVAFVLPYPIVVAKGASVGLVLGGLLAFLLLHEFANLSAPQANRVRRTPQH